MDSRRVNFCGTIEAMNAPANTPIAKLKDYLPYLIDTLEKKAKLTPSEEAMYLGKIGDALKYMSLPEHAQRYSIVIPLLEKTRERLLMSASGLKAIAEAALNAKTALSELEELPPVE